MTLGAELYATIRDSGRERVCDVAKAIAHPEMHDKLHIAPFDIIDIEGEPCEVTHYKEKWTKLHRWFNAGTLVQPESMLQRHQAEMKWKRYTTSG